MGLAIMGDTQGLPVGTLSILHLYRVGWGSWTGFGGDLDFGHSTTCPAPSSAWADGTLAESTVQLGNMVERLNQSQPNPGPRPPAPP